MAVSYEYARQFVGQSVCAHCQGGRKYYGIVREVTRDGIMIDPLPVRGTLAGGNSKDLQVGTADRPEAVQAENVFFPLFFLPFLTLLALSPFFFRPFGFGYGGYGGYGYPGYW